MLSDSRSMAGWPLRATQYKYLPGGIACLSFHARRSSTIAQNDSLTLFI
jgi:hypothetical protein